ncbi:MAG: fibronectin type III domain-containing protein [Balneolaceae bacterium]|nr:fibronectin type III domain-containing protein [Balneolaceae bacterium]
MQRLDSIFKTLSIFGLIILFVNGCGTEPEFNRDNKNDPEVKNFSPKTGRFSLSLKSNKTVHLGWNDISDFETGYLIWKSLGDNKNKQLLAELDKNVTGYIDQTGEIDKTTTYYLAARSEHNSNYDSLNSKNKLINFTGGIEELSFDRIENLFSIKWNNSLVISDFIIISRFYQNNEIEILDTLNRAIEEYQFINQEEDYSTHVMVSSYMINHQNESQLLNSSKTKRIFYNTPLFHSLTFENEAIGKIEYEDISTFNDKILVYQRSKRYCSDSFGQWTFADTLNEDDGTFQINSTTNTYYEFSLTAKHDGLESAMSSIITEDPGSSPPKNIRIEELSDQTIRISWEDSNSSTMTFKYILQRRNGDYGSYSTIAELGPEINTYIIDDISLLYVEHFRIRTYSSEYATFRYDGRN